MSLLSGTIVGVSVAVLVVLFSIQQFGTSKIGYSFAPVMAVFFAFNSVVGAYNIAKYQPGIFKVRGLVSIYRYRHISSCALE